MVADNYTKEHNLTETPWVWSTLNVDHIQCVSSRLCSLFNNDSTLNVDHIQCVSSRLCSGSLYHLTETLMTQ